MSVASRKGRSVIEAAHHFNGPNSRLLNIEREDAARFGHSLSLSLWTELLKLAPFFLELHLRRFELLDLPKRFAANRKQKATVPARLALVSRLGSQSDRPSFGIAFDIDGVVLLGHTPIGGSPRALRRLYDDSGNLKIPFVFLTNGGGFSESKRAQDLGQLVGVNILPSQVIQGHTPFKQLVNRFENELVVAVGKGEPAAVMSEYGYKNVLSVDEYTSYFDAIDPLAPYKRWTTKADIDQNSSSNEMAKRKIAVQTQRVQAAFVVSDSVDWSRDIQVVTTLMDLVLS
ncbi:uncharacterized protein YKR070W-like [Eucalyptus grandis]|uniref:uncharacterized protein YKR070W-like n=1 Tax=Eucalyptus grandis TaxID=71139 RepID=UPI00192EB4F5|nr:uncharacterized protein YKR070W-like [Eucalyptus grandis]